MQCTLGEISFALGCDPDTLEAACVRERQMSFSDYRRRRAAGGKMSLRRAMWKSAIQHNSTHMQMFLYEKHLAQDDQVKEAEAGHIVFDVEFGAAIGTEEDDKGLPTPPDAKDAPPKPDKI